MMSIQITIDEFKEYLDGPILDLVKSDQDIASPIIQKIVDQLKNKAKKGIIEFDENSGIITIDEKKINAIKLEEGEISPLRGGMKIIQNLSFENIDISDIMRRETPNKRNDLIKKINVEILKSFDYFINYELTERANKDYEQQLLAKKTKPIDNREEEIKNNDIQNSPPPVSQQISKQIDTAQEDVKLNKRDFNSPEKISIFNSMNQYMQRSNVNIDEEEKFLNKNPKPTRTEIFNRISGRKNNPTPQKNNSVITDEQARNFFAYAIQQRKVALKNIKSTSDKMDSVNEEKINNYFNNMSLKDLQKEIELYQNGINFENNNFTVKLTPNDRSYGSTYENQGAMRSTYNEDNPIIQMIDQYSLRVIMKVIEKALEKKLNENKGKILLEISKRLKQEEKENKKLDELNKKERATSLKDLNQSSSTKPRRLSSFGSFKSLGFSDSYRSLSSLGNSIRRSSDADKKETRTRSPSPKLRKDTDD